MMDRYRLGRGRESCVDLSDLVLQVEASSRLVNLVHGFANISHFNQSEMCNV